MFSYDISLGHWHTNLEHAFTVHQICITPSPLHSTCPCHPSLHLFITFPIASIPVLACRSVLVGLSLGETPHIHLIIPISFNSIFGSRSHGLKAVYILRESMTTGTFKPFLYKPVIFLQILPRTLTLRQPSKFCIHLSNYDLNVTSVYIVSTCRR